MVATVLCGFEPVRLQERKKMQKEKELEKNRKSKVKIFERHKDTGLQAPISAKLYAIPISNLPKPHLTKLFQQNTTFLTC